MRRTITTPRWSNGCSANRMRGFNLSSRSMHSRLALPTVYSTASRSSAAVAWNSIRSDDLGQPFMHTTTDKTSYCMVSGSCLPSLNELATYLIGRTDASYQHPKLKAQTQRPRLKETLILSSRGIDELAALNHTPTARRGDVSQRRPAWTTSGRTTSMVRSRIRYFGAFFP